MKGQLTNLGYNKKGHASYTVRFTVSRKDIPAEFFTKDSSGTQSKPINSKIAGFLGAMKLSSINEDYTWVITKSQKNKEALLEALMTNTGGNEETAKLIEKFNTLSPVSGENTWVKSIGDDRDKEFGIDLLPGFVPVITRTTVNPELDTIQPVMNPQTKEVVTYKSLPVYESTDIGYSSDCKGDYEFDLEGNFVWSHQVVAESTGVGA